VAGRRVQVGGDIHELKSADTILNACDLSPEAFEHGFAIANIVIIVVTPSMDKNQTLIGFIRWLTEGSMKIAGACFHGFTLII
jgi:hypothetical protein